MEVWKMSIAMQCRKSSFHRWRSFLHEFFLAWLPKLMQAQKAQEICVGHGTTKPGLGLAGSMLTCYGPPWPSDCFALCLLRCALGQSLSPPAACLGSSQSSQSPARSASSWLPCPPSHPSLSPAQSEMSMGEPGDRSGMFTNRCRALLGLISSLDRGD